MLMPTYTIYTHSIEKHPYEIDLMFFLVWRTAELFCAGI